MLTTANLVSRISDVPNTWIFQYYLNLTESLSGQSVKMHSKWNTQDKTPSMHLFCKGEEYLFKDFSTGKGGDAVTLVAELLGMDNRTAMLKIMDDYSKWKQQYGSFKQGPVQEESNYHVTEYAFRVWNTDDAHFWTRFNIGSTLLGKYNVWPLEGYFMEKHNPDGTVSRIHIQRPYIYGYFRKDGTLYKIYQPKNKERKFIKVQNDYIQGTDQRKGHKNLMVLSSLKDIMAVDSLKIQMDFVAPDSENQMISLDVMDSYIQNYHQVFLLFDGDEAGYKATLKYVDTYKEHITPIYWKMEKDPSDGIARHGAQAVQRELVVKINSKLKPYVDLSEHRDLVY